jgi:MOSC domain-containing protein YiiM
VKILSVQVGRPQPVIFDGRMARTGIYKSPVRGPVRVGTLNIEGDEQADLTVHGGVNKAVYAYPSEHYEFWRKHYPALELNWGAFGENLTTEGFLEADAGIGDTVQIGTAKLVVVQPRLPCFKLAGKFGDKNILQTFTESGRSGIYFAVIEEGHLQSGDVITWKSRMDFPFTIADAMRLYNEEKLPPQVLDRALELKALPDSWRRRILESQARNKI